MTRHESREIAFSIIFQKNFHKDTEVEEIITHNINSEFHKESAFAIKVAQKTFENIEVIDELIAKNLVGWSSKRISKVSNAILRLATCEMLYSDDVPVSVAINEAVEIAKKYSTKEDASYINGVLGTIAKEVESQQQ
ncbi:MAG: transcription antitermination factor NusB [Clostridia bacterium]